MSILSFLLLLLIAGIVGSLGAALVGTRGFGCLLSIVVGFLGAFIGSIIARSLHLAEPFNINVDGYSFPLVWSILGSIVIVGILSLVSYRRFRI